MEQKWQELRRHDYPTNMFVLGNVSGYFIINVLESSDKRGFFDEMLGHFMKGQEVEKLWDKLRKGKTCNYLVKEKNYTLNTDISMSGDVVSVHIHETIKTREGLIERDYSSESAELAQDIQSYAREHAIKRKWESAHGF